VRYFALNVGPAPGPAAAVKKNPYHAL